MNYLSVCAVFKNEALYLREWIEFYISQGVEHFYLYNNASTDDFQSIIKAYRELITFHNIPGRKQWWRAYDHCIRAYSKDTVYCVFLDVDEFLYSSIDVRFRDTLGSSYEYSDVSVIVVPWLNFGSSGQEVYCNESVVKRFTYRAISPQSQVKSIVRLQDAVFSITSHSFVVKQRVIDENFEEHFTWNIPNRANIYSQCLEDPTANIFRLNHYLTKSKEECLLRGIRFRVEREYSGEDFFKEYDINEVEDKELANRYCAVI